MKIGIKVGDIMTRNYISTSPETNVVQCCKKMVKNKVGSVVVLDKEKRLQGILTEKDVIVAVSKGKDLSKIAVKDIMTKRVITIKPNKDIYDALVLMKKKNIRRLPVVENKKVIGIITIKDILKIEPALFEIARDYMRISEEREKLKRIKQKEIYEELYEVPIE